MDTIRFTNAYYIKLGKGGKWEKSSIQENKMRIGWKDWELKEINQGDWDAIKENHRHEYKTKGAATADINALKIITESTPDDIWITFYENQLWWCRLGEIGIDKDKVSKYRPLSEKWRCEDINQMVLFKDQIPGSISKIARFQATVCTLGKIELEALKRLLNNLPSEAHETISRIKTSLVTEVSKGMDLLHWKDFEILVDLVFRNAGWRRVSLLGEDMKDFDLVLEEPITRSIYPVQVKSRAPASVFEEFAKKFSSDKYRKMYFVVRVLDENLAAYPTEKYPDVELILQKQLAEMVVDLGLTDWLMKKIR